MRKNRMYLVGMLALFILTTCYIPACAEETESELLQPSQEETIAIISAMDNEIALLLESADIDHVDHIGSRDYHVGELCGKHVVIVKAGIGKIRCAAGTATLINMYHPSRIIFTGIAGGVGDETQLLDVVVATDLVEHDYGQITNDGFEWTYGYNGVDGFIHCDPELVSLATDCAAEVVGEEHTFQGTIATGDQFVASEEYVKGLQEDFNAIACEMEGMAVAVVCEEYEVPFVVIRAMSDKADGKAHFAYLFMGNVAADHSSEIVMKMLENL